MKEVNQLNEKYYQLEQKDKAADIYIFGDITSWPWLESDVSAYNLSKEIAGAGRGCNYYPYQFIRRRSGRGTGHL